QTRGDLCTGGPPPVTRVERIMPVRRVLERGAVRACGFEAEPPPPQTKRATKLRPGPRLRVGRPIIAPRRRPASGPLEPHPIFVAFGSLRASPWHLQRLGGHVVSRRCM